MGEQSGEIPPPTIALKTDQLSPPNKRFYAVYEDVVQTYLPENIIHSPHLITSIGCGMAQEVIPIIHGNSKAHYLGIDGDPRMSWNNGDLDNTFSDPEQRKRALITNHNAADSDAYAVGKDWPQKSNIVVIRNPDLHTDYEENWGSVLEEARHHVADDHIVIVTLDDQTYLNIFLGISNGILEIVETRKQPAAISGHPEKIVVIGRFKKKE